VVGDHCAGVGALSCADFAPLGRSPWCRKYGDIALVFLLGGSVLRTFQLDSVGLDYVQLCGMALDVHAVCS